MQNIDILLFFLYLASQNNLLTLEMLVATFYLLFISIIQIDHSLGKPERDLYSKRFNLDSLSYIIKLFTIA